MLEAQYNLGLSYTTGEGVRQDYSKALLGIEEQHYRIMLIVSTRLVGCMTMAMAFVRALPKPNGGTKWLAIMVMKMAVIN